MCVASEPTPLEHPTPNAIRQPTVLVGVVPRQEHVQEGLCVVSSEHTTTPVNYAPNANMESPARRAKVSCAEISLDPPNGCSHTLRDACAKLREACDVLRRETCAAPPAHLQVSRLGSEDPACAGPDLLAGLLDCVSQLLLILGRERGADEGALLGATKTVNLHNSENPKTRQKSRRKPAQQADGLYTTGTGNAQSAATTAARPPESAVQQPHPTRR